MPVKLHLLGGSGRIGRALVDSLVTYPLADLTAIQIYCDSTKATTLQAHYTSSTSPRVTATGYSAFSTITEPIRSPLADSEITRHIVFNLRGINNKQRWLNQTLDSLELHVRSCRTLVDSDLWMEPGTEIFHFSSLLCN